MIILISFKRGRINHFFYEVVKNLLSTPGKKQTSDLDQDQGTFSGSSGLELVHPVFIKELGTLKDRRRNKLSTLTNSAPLRRLRNAEPDSRCDSSTF